MFGVGRTRKVWYHVLFLPPDLKAALPFERYPRLRVEGEIADVPMQNTFIPAGGGRSYVIVSPDIRKNAALELGDRVFMRFRIADQDHVDVPTALAAAIANHAGWAVLTPGKRRALAQHVASAKTEATRTRRVADVMGALTSHGGDLRAWRKAGSPRP